MFSLHATDLTLLASLLVPGSVLRFPLHIQNPLSVAGHHSGATGNGLKLFVTARRQFLFLKRLKAARPKTAKNKIKKYWRILHSSEN